MMVTEVFGGETDTIYVPVPRSNDQPSRSGSRGYRPAVMMGAAAMSHVPVVIARMREGGGLIPCVPGDLGEALEDPGRGIESRVKLLVLDCRPLHGRVEGRAGEACVIERHRSQVFDLGLSLLGHMAWWCYQVVKLSDDGWGAGGSVTRLSAAIAGGGGVGGGARVCWVMDDVNYVGGMMLPRQVTLALPSSLANERRG